MSSSRTEADTGSARRKGILAGISTNVLVLGIVSLLTDMSSEMIYPVLPLFLVSIGATGVFIGLIEGAAETTASLLKVVSGWYSDRFRRRKPFILGGYGASSLVKPVLIVASSPWHVLAIRITERIGKGIRSAPRDALIADSTGQDVRGKAFGLHKALDSTGAVLGPILVLVVLALAAGSTEEEQYRLVFAIATIPAFAALLVILFMVRDKEGVMKGSSGTFLKEMRHLGKPFWTLIAVTVTFYIGEISYAFFILQAQNADLDETTIIALYILFNLVFVLVAIPSGQLSDRFGRRPVIAASFLIFALTSAVMAIGGSLMILALGFSLFGLYKGSSEGVFKAYVTDVVPGNLRGTALGAFHTSVGMVMLPGGIIAGVLWDSVGPWATFVYGAVMALLAVLLLMLLGRGRKSAVSQA